MVKLIPISLVITELYVGGAERNLVHLACGLDRRQFVPRVVSLGSAPPADQAALVDQLRAADVPVTFLDADHWSAFPRAARRLRALLRGDRPRIVQSFLFHANVLAAWVKGRDDFRLVTGIRVADPRRWRHRVERWASGRADRVVCVSDAVAAVARGQTRVAAEKLRVIPNGVDCRALQAAAAADLAPWRLPADTPVLLFVGRLDRQKGLDWFLTLCPRILQQLPRHHVVLVGEGPARGALAEQARQLGIADRVHLVGWQACPAEFVNRADLLVLPSRWEGMPNVLLEAMCAGKPVVATETHGVQEVLGSLSARQTLPFGDPEFADRVVELAASPGDLGEQNRRRATGAFSLRRAVESYEQLYHELLGAE